MYNENRKTHTHTLTCRSIVKKSTTQRTIKQTMARRTVRVAREKMNVCLTIFFRVVYKGKIYQSLYVHIPKFGPFFSCKKNFLPRKWNKYFKNLIIFLLQTIFGHMHMLSTHRLHRQLLKIGNGMKYFVQLVCSFFPLTPYCIMP